MHTWRYIPENIIHIIGSYAVEHSKQFTVSKNNYKLELIAVCQRWRKVILPIAFKHAFYFQTYNFELDSYIKSTNLDTISALGYSRYVKNLQLSIRGAEYSEYFVNSVCQILLYDPFMWINLECISFLAVDLVLTTENDIDSNNTSHGYFTYCDIASIMVSKFPNVKHFYFTIENVTDTSSEFSHIILNAYCKQLASFSSRHFTNLNHSVYFENLVNLKLDLENRSDCILPRINISKLENLTLTGLSANFSWMSLLPENAIQNVICFSNLKKITICYLKANVDDEQEDRNKVNMIEAALDVQKKQPNDLVKIEFPMLQNLNLTQVPASFFTNYVYSFPKKLEKLDVYYSALALSCLSCMGIELTKQLCIILGNVLATEADYFYSSTNHFLGQKDNLAKSIISFRDFDTFDYKKINWERAQCVTINSAIGFDTLKNLIAKLPQLDTLNVKQVEINTSDNAYCLLDSHKNRKIENELLNNKLGYISISEYIFHQDYELAKNGLKYLINRLPNICYILVMNAPYERLFSFAVNGRKWDFLSGNITPIGEDEDESMLSQDIFNGKHFEQTEYFVTYLP